MTGEQKTDWMVRLNNEGIYPRPELIAEYRRESAGRSLRLSSIHRLLKEMNVSEEVVNEIKTAEDSANAEVRATYTLIASPQIHTSHRSISEQTFDYSTHNGQVRLSTSHGDFDLQFSKASDKRIYLIKAGNAARIARGKTVNPGQIVYMQEFDTTSHTYSIGLGEAFFVENAAGALLVGRIEHIADDTRNNAPADEVRFIYSTFANGLFAIAV